MDFSTGQAGFLSAPGAGAGGTSRPVFFPLRVRFPLGVLTSEAEMLKAVLLLQDLAGTPLPSA